MSHYLERFRFIVLFENSEVVVLLVWKEVGGWG